MTRSMIMANDVPLKISPDATHISADSGIRSRCSPASGEIFVLMLREYADYSFNYFLAEAVCRL